jgi:hypothetical protein
LEIQNQQFDDGAMAKTTECMFEIAMQALGMPWFTYWINLNVRLDVLLSEKGIRIGIWKPQRITGFGLPSLLEE